MLDNQVRISDRVVDWDGSSAIMFDEWDFIDVDKLMTWLANSNCWKLSDTQMQKFSPIDSDHLYHYLRNNFYASSPLLDPMWFLKESHGNDYNYTRIKSFFPYLATYEYDEQLIVCALYMAVSGKTKNFRDELVTTWRNHLVEALQLLINGVPADDILRIIELGIDTRLVHHLYNGLTN